MLTSSHGARPSFRHHHVSVHRRRRIDQAAARGRGRSVRGGACCESPCCRARGVRRDRAASRWTPRVTPSSSRSPRPSEQRSAAPGVTDALAPGRIRLRVGLHTGTPPRNAEGYVGEDVHLAARIGAAGRGGQMLVSRAARELLGSDVALTDLGEHRLKDIDRPISIFQLGSETFPPLRTISNTNLPRPPTSFVGRATELEDGSRGDQGRSTPADPHRPGRVGKDAAGARGCHRPWFPSTRRVSSGSGWLRPRQRARHRARSPRRSGRRTASRDISATGRCCFSSTTWST